MYSANQLYKNSGSELTFKEWLKREQLKGTLQKEQPVKVEPKPVKEKFLNADGDGVDAATEEFHAKICGGTTQENVDAVKKLCNTKMIFGLVIGIGLGYGIKWFIDRRK